MKEYKKIVSFIKKASPPLLKMIESGLNPKEVKETVIMALEPYFENKDILEHLAIESLVPESINLLKLQEDKWLLKMFEKCLGTYRSAKSKNLQNCLESLAFWQPQILQSLSKYWSILYLEVDKSNLEIEEFLHECFRNIADIIEGVTKPFLKSLLNQIMLENEIKTNSKDIDALSLGRIVNDLILRSGYADLFTPPPWGIKLNQWRNIAYHHSARIEKNEIVCKYGKSPNVKEIRLSRDELLQVVQTGFNIHKVIKLAHTLFFVDNIEGIDKFSPLDEVREEAEFFTFATGLASQGFEIVEFKRNTDEAKLVVKDVSHLNPDQRRLHASQFLFPLWLITKSKQIVVEYIEKDNTPNLHISTNSTICEKIYNQELNPLALAKMMNMVDLKTNKEIPKME